ncbi:MAG: hypothetical protein P8Y60_13490, partial [Calditrichota bacterium]
MDTFKKYILFMVLFPLLVWGWGAGQTASDLQPFLPGKLFDNTWTLDGEVEEYRPENLFQYIDGEAEMYNDYGFVDMITAYYINDQRTDLAFSLDIYDMGSPLNAFGIYSAYRRPDLRFAPFGKEATVSSTNIRLYKGRYFVQVNVGAIDTVAAQAIRNCARDVAGKLPSGGAPAELSWLPADGQVAHSLAYKT